MAVLRASAIGRPVALYLLQLDPQLLYSNRLLSESVTLWLSGRWLSRNVPSAAYEVFLWTNSSSVLVLLPLLPSLPGWSPLPLQSLPSPPTQMGQLAGCLPSPPFWSMGQLLAAPLSSPLAPTAAGG